jgi:hypothetical protein
LQHPPATTAGEGETVDVLAWARGTENYLTAPLFKAAKAQFNFTPKSVEELIDFMLDAGLITIEEIGR